MERKSSNLFDVVAQGDDVNLQRLLLEAKEERNVATLAHGNTVLHEAAWNGFSRCVQVLCNLYPKDLDENSNKEKLSWKKNHFINRVNFCGFSALHLAAQNGHNQTLRELLYAGCSTSIHNDYGDTPLHTACRYGHAGVVRILISAKCDVDAFNLNHDTPLHITCAMGRRKLTKILLEAEAMQFQNLHHETPLDIASRKKLREIVEIMTTYKEKLDTKKMREAARNSNTPNSDQQPHLPHNSKLKFNNQQHWSPYGCHYYPDTRNFPSPNIESLPKEPLEKGEQYFLDLAGNIRKGPVGRGNKCCCAMLDKNENCRNAQAHETKSDDGMLDLKINALASKFKRTKNRHTQLQKSTRKSKERRADPLYPMLKIVGDKNKQIQMKQWLHKVYPEIGSNSDLQPSGTSKEVAVDVHRDPVVVQPGIKISRNDSRRMPAFDENGNGDTTQTTQQEDDDENYTDISNESEGESGNGSIISSNENGLYDEGFLRNFQHQQLAHSTLRDDSVTSPSINSNQNIELEMERITKSLLMDSDGLMVSTNPDVIRDHIHHSAKRSTKKIKSAITKSTVLTSGDLYVNTFFNNSRAVRDADETDSIEIDELISTVHKTMINSSNVSSVSSATHRQAFGRVRSPLQAGLDNQNVWNQASRSRNPLPMDIDEIEKLSENIFNSNETLEVTPTLNNNNFVLLDQLMKERKKFNQTYQQQLEVMNRHLNFPPDPSINVSDDQKTNNDSTIPSSSTLV